jgi:hypothetical protein
MLVLKLEVWPQGNRHAAKSLGEIRIANDMTGSATTGASYRASIEMVVDGSPRTIRGVTIRGPWESFKGDSEEIRTSRAWVLVVSALRALFPYNSRA